MTSMPLVFETFCMSSILLFALFPSQVLSQSPIANIGVLDNYLGGATRFLHNRPLFNGLTLVVPKAPLQHSPPYHRHFHHRPLHRVHDHHRPFVQGKHHPLYPHLDPLPQDNPLPPPLPLSPQLLLSPIERPAYNIPEVPIVHSIIVPKNEDKLGKGRRRRKPKSKHRRHRKHKSYPKSINDRLKEKEEQEEEQKEDPDWNNDIAEYDDHYEEPPKSLYDSMPPFSKPKRPAVDTLKDKQRQELAKNKTNLRISQMRNSPSIPMIPTQKTTKRPKTSEFMSQSWGINSDNKEPIPRYSERIRKPVIQNSPQISANEKPKNSQPSKKKNNYRTATANQLSHKDDNRHKQLSDDEHTHSRSELEGIKGEDLRSNDDPKAYPHQYAIEIRWKGKDRDHMDMDEPEGDTGDREMHSSKDLDHARHRKYKHEEEEHWHEKDWLDEGLRKAYLNGKPVPVHIVKPGIKLDSEPNYGPMPLYAQPMPTGATLDQINQHFAIPTPNFRVNNRFMQWAKSAIDLNGLQNNYITFYR